MQSLARHPGIVSANQNIAILGTLEVLKKRQY